jgi:hypothetical protein
MVTLHVQDELVAGKYMRAPPDAELAARSAAKAKKAAAKAGKKGERSEHKGCMRCRRTAMSSRMHVHI